MTAIRIRIIKRIDIAGIARQIEIVSLRFVLKIWRQYKFFRRILAQARCIGSDRIYGTNL